MNLITGVLLYLALLVVMALHEIGYSPREIRLQMKYWLLPNFYAVKGDHRLGGILMLAAIVLGVALWQPASTFIQYVGLMAFAYGLTLMIYSIFKEKPDISQKARKKYILDPVPKNTSGWYLIGTIIVFAVVYEYYWAIIGGLC